MRGFHWLKTGQFSWEISETIHFLVCKLYQKGTKQRRFDFYSYLPSPTHCFQLKIFSPLVISSDAFNFPLTIECNQNQPATLNTSAFCFFTFVPQKDEKRRENGKSNRFKDGNSIFGIMGKIFYQYYFYKSLKYCYYNIGKKGRLQKKWLIMLVLFLEALIFLKSDAVAQIRNKELLINCQMIFSRL